MLKHSFLVADGYPTGHLNQQKYNYKHNVMNKTMTLPRDYQHGEHRGMTDERLLNEMGISEIIYAQ